MTESTESLLRDEPLPDSYLEIQARAFRVMGFIGVALSGLALLLLFVSWAYVLRHRRRRLGTLRLCLCAAPILVALVLLAASRSNVLCAFSCSTTDMSSKFTSFTSLA